MKFSIVTAVKNGAATLEATLASVFAQTWPGREIIVQDGGSTDGTLDILKAWPDVNWRSEPDTGVYDAWNKALQRVTGDWVLFLGADDCLLHKNVLIQCRRHLRLLPETVIFAYGALLFNKLEDEEHHMLFNRSVQNVYHCFLLNMGFPFPATFVRASLFREQTFDASYAIAGDYAFTALHVTRFNVARLPVMVSFMQRGGLSDSTKHADKLLEERLRVLRTCVAPRAGEFVNAVADHFMDEDLSLEDIPKD